MLVERVTMAKGGMPPRNKKNFRATKKGAGMTEGQRRSAVARKRAAANVGPNPTNVKTFAKRKNMGMGGLV